MPSEVKTSTLAAGVAAAATIVEIGVIFAATDAVVGTSATRTRSGNALLGVVSVPPLESSLDAELVVTPPVAID
mgnify:CR=1 FL=1